MGMEIVTGVSEREHVSSAQDGRRNAFTFGSGRYVFDSGGKFSYTLISNNLIRISDGDLMDQGRHICTEPNDYTELAIDNGISGNNRKDIIAVRYEKNADTGIETASLVVIKGTSTAGTASDPEYIEGNILSGDLVDEFPLYRVNLSGISIVSVDVLFQIFPGSGIIGTLPLTGDSADNIATFTTGDSEDSTGWTDVALLSSGEKHSSLFNKISTMFKNVRYLYKMLGTTDISGIGNGTVTGAIGQLDTNFSKLVKTVQTNIATSATIALKQSSYYAPTIIWLHNASSYGEYVVARNKIDIVK